MAPGTLDSRRLRAAQNQSFFREVNERIDDIAHRWATPCEYICECLDTQCSERVVLTADEYRDIRSRPDCFFVLDGHEVDEIERTISRTDRYLVVSKLGVGGEAARAAARRGTLAAPAEPA